MNATYYLLLTTYDLSIHYEEEKNNHFIKNNACGLYLVLLFTV